MKGLPVRRENRLCNSSVIPTPDWFFGSIRPSAVFLSLAGPSILPCYLLSILQRVDLERLGYDGISGPCRIATMRETLSITGV